MQENWRHDIRYKKIHRVQSQRFYTFETRAQRIPRFIIPKNHAKTTCKIEIHHSNEKSRERNQLRRRINDFSLFFFLFSSLDTREIRISMDARGSEFSFAIEQFNKPQSVSDLANFPPPQEGHSPPSTVYIYIYICIGLAWRGNSSWSTNYSKLSPTFRTPPVQLS